MATTLAGALKRLMYPLLPEGDDPIQFIPLAVPCLLLLTQDAGPHIGMRDLPLLVLLYWIAMIIAIHGTSIGKL